jgi:hypothetical protein
MVNRPNGFIQFESHEGAALLLNGQAETAEAVFRADLEQYPRNPRSPFGLLKGFGGAGEESQRGRSSNGI